MMRELPVVLRSLSYLRPSMIFWRIHREIKARVLTLVLHLGAGKGIEPRAGSERLHRVPPLPCHTQAEAIDLEQLRFQFLRESVDLPRSADQWSRHLASRPLLWRFHFGYHDYLPVVLRDASDPVRARTAVTDFLRAWEVAFPASAPDSRTFAWHPYVLSIRIESWCRLAAEFQHDGDPTEVCALLERGIEKMTRVLLRNLEYGTMANHLLRNIKALCFAGLCLDGPLAHRALARGTHLLIRELREQILADGMHFERSPMYHVSILSDLMDLADVFEARAMEEPQGLGPAIHSMTRMLEILIHPDGEIPFLNDSTRSFTLITADVLKRAIARVGEREGAVEEIHASPELDAKHWSGLMVLRSPRMHLVFDAGNIGVDYQPGHAHCDTLSFELSWQGRRLCTDTGVYHYRESPERIWSRSTAAHSTLSIDGAEQSEVWKSFRVGRRARVIGTRAMNSNGWILFQGVHNGFTHLAPDLLHERSVVIAPDAWLAIVDHVSGSGSHRLDSWVHLAPEVTIQQEGKNLMLSRGDEEFVVRGWGYDNLDSIVTPYYPSFGVQVSRAALHAQVHTALPHLSVLLLGLSGPLPEIHLDLKGAEVRISTATQALTLTARTSRAHPLSLPVFSP